MDKNSKSILAVYIAGLAIVAIAIGAVATRPINVSVDTPGPTVGSLAGPDIASPYLKWGGGATYRVTGQCYSGLTAQQAATSTLFKFQNPWNATSTVTLATISGVNGATTTDIIVATSTTPNPAGAAVATSSVQGNLFSMHSVTNGTQFNSVAGVTFGPGTGYRAPSAGTYATSQRTVVLGPLEWIVGFATSTNPSGNGGIAAHSLSLPTSCDYRFDIERNVGLY